MMTLGFKELSNVAALVEIASLQRLVT